MMKSKRLLILLMVLFGCTFSTFYIKSNNSIPQSTKSEITVAIDSICNNLFHQKTNYILSIADSSLKTTLPFFDSSCKYLTFDNTAFLKPLDQYLIKNDNNLLIDSVYSLENGYTIKFNPKPLSYIYLLPLLLSDKKITCLLTCIFNKNNSTWQLSDLCIGSHYYAFNGYTAQDYYKFSLDAYNKRKLLSAYFDIQFAENTLHPAFNYFRYLNEDSINELSNKIENDLKEKKVFPIILGDIEGQPEIIIISTKLIGGTFHKKGLYSFIYCKSKINVTDTNKIKKVAYDVGEIIGNYIPEVNTVNDSIGYRFYNYSDSDIKIDDPHYTVFLPIASKR